MLRRKRNSCVVACLHYDLISGSSAQIIPFESYVFENRHYELGGIRMPGLLYIIKRRLIRSRC